MKPHPFAALIYSVEETLGLWHKARKSEQSNRSPFDAHREHFQDIDPRQCDKDDYLPRLDEICKRLHEGCNVPSEMIYNHINILESIYNSLARQPNIMEIYVYQPTEYYILTTLIPLICADILIYKENANEDSIYYHLDRLLKEDGLIVNHGERHAIQKILLKKYIRKYIDKYLIHDIEQLNKGHHSKPELLMPELMDYLNELPKSENQTCVTLHKKVNEYKNRLLLENLVLPFTNIKPVIAAYTAAIILLNIDKRAKLLRVLHETYNSMVCNEDELLCKLKSNLYAALSDNYRDIDNIKENTLILDHNYNLISTDLLLEIKRKNNIKKVTMNIVKLWLLNYPPQILQMFAPFPELESYLSKLVSIPPQLNSPMIYSNITEYARYKRAAIGTDVIVFNAAITTPISELTNDEASKINTYYSQYKPLIDSLNYIQSNYLTAAFEAIKNTDSKSMPIFGFIKHALAVLNIGLLYKLQKGEIKHLSLMRQVNDIINHQGIVFIPIVTPDHVNTESDSSWLSMDEYLKHSLVKGSSTYNTIILQAIYAYNFTVARHTTTHKLFSDPINPLIKRVKLLDINYSSHLVIHDFLEQFNTLSGKILLGLHRVSIDVSPKIFARELIREKIVTLNDLKDNLLHCIDGSSLGVCLLDHLTIIQFCSVPGDDVDNIVVLGKNTKVVELLFRAYQYHSSSK